MTTATAPTPTDPALASEPSAVVAAVETPVASTDGDKGTLLTTQAEPQKDPATPADLKLALPDGSPLNPDVLSRITDLAQKAGVTDATAAQALVDLLNGEVGTTLDALKISLARGGETWTTMVRQMEQQALSDPDLGNNDTAKLTQVVAEAKQVMAKYAPEGFDAYLDESGLGSDPRFLKFARKVYEGMREDKLVNGSPPPAKPKTAAQRMYPNMPSVDG